ncbi:MAG TPA: NAD(P)-dependent oxidoreductase [Microlunatus sp.]
MSERVAVTGSSGHLGRAVVEDLIGHGYDVVGIDRVATTETTHITHAWDGRSVEAMAEYLEGCKALIHLAAIPAPIGHPPEVVFTNNTQATFAALEAAGSVGIRRAAIASSGSAYGTAWSPQPTRARYVPIDEDHPMINFDPYGLSKEVDERTAAVMTRRFSMSVVALRFHWIATRADQLATIAARRQGSRDWDDELRNLWGYVDLRDAASACRLAIEAAADKPYGFVPLNIVAADSLVEVPIADLLAEHAPEIEIRSRLGPTQGGFAIDRAAEVIGWVPRHSWRDADDPSALS